MARLAFVIFMMIISGIVFLVKKGASVVTGKDVSFKDETGKVMHTTAKGINWMNEQWEKAKANAGVSSNTKYIESNNFSEMSAFEIIVRVKSEPTKFDSQQAESTYIEQAVSKMNKRQFDDAYKLVMQLPDGEAREFMLKEIEQKRSI